MTRVRVEGLKELDAALGELSKGVARGVLRRTLLKAGVPMLEAARRNAPRDTGALAERGIQMGTRITKIKGGDPGNRAYAATMKAGGSRADAVQALRDARREQGVGQDFAEVFIGPVRSNKKNTIKAYVQEFGSSKQEKQPYMRPAFDSEKNTVLNNIKGELTTEIGKAVQRARRRALKKAGGG